MEHRLDPDDDELLQRITHVSSAASGVEALSAGSSDSQLSIVEVGLSPEMAATEPAERPDARRAADPALRLRSVEARYTARKTLGRGGMGEVLLCRDHTIGRDVAMKRIRDRRGVGPGSGMQRRFVREARVQGQLEHPAIVPVYDVGLTADGALYFTMKRVRGASLCEIIRALRHGEREVAQRYSRRRLLTTFSNVCMAVHFAHEKGVVHRDLKPSNIMLGDFGEVYVLDWGLASLRGTPEHGHEAVEDGPSRQTLGGGAMGTPGYMAPEQIENASSVDARADVYALGVILFELLTLETVHVAPRVADVLMSTLALDGASPSERAPGRDVPPELDRLCRAATRVDPASRLPSAKEMSIAVEAYLDGDRDIALRRELAVAHARRARGALDRAGAPGASEHDERALAMREVTAALGLDPNNQGARETLIRLIAEPPATVPREAEDAIAANHAAAYQFAGRAGRLFYFSYLLYLPLLLWMGVRDWRLFTLGWATIGACAITTHVLLRRPPGRVDVPLVHLVVSTFTVAAVSVMFGPFVLVPMLALGNSVAYIASVGHARGLVPVAGCLAVIVPAALGWLGITPSPYLFEDGRWIILPTVFHISPVATQVFLVAGILGTVAPACFFVARLRKAFGDAERKLQLQAWQLRQIVPGDATR